MNKTAVLLMSYGSPRNLEEVAPYYADIRGGRPPGEEALKNLVDRYEAVGGPSKLNELTRRQAEALGAELERRRPGALKVFVGMKHWHPFISEAMGKISGGNFTSLIGLVLAPHFSKKSIGEYESRISAAMAESKSDLHFQMVHQWYDEPAFVDFVVANLKSTLSEWDTGAQATKVFFTAHSIPSRIVAEGDPYADQLALSAKTYAEAAGISNFGIGWQSASNTPEPWLGPDILDVLKDFKQADGERAVVAPVGFVSDHLEVTYDVDIECMELGRQIDLEVRRIPSPNDDPRFISALADVVMRYAEK